MDGRWEGRQERGGPGTNPPPLRGEGTDDPTLGRLRSALEEVDGALVGLLAERCELARRVGEWKAGQGVPVMDPTQEARVVRRAAERARTHSLDEEGVRRLFWEIMALARRAQAGEHR